MSLLTSVQQRAADSGLNMFGLVDAQRFDKSQPCEQRSRAIRRDCGSIVVLGTGGRSFWHAYRRKNGAEPADVDSDAADRYAASGVESVAAVLGAAGLACCIVDARTPRVNFGRLAEAAGFGIVSPVSGMLLHPDYGPWLRVREALLVDGTPFGPIADASIADWFKPCCGCARPCLSACPQKVHDGFGRSDRCKCAEHRHAGGCGDGCESRMACPVGREHRDDGPTLHAHSIGRRTMQRWYGLGAWRVVPRFLRGAPRV